MANDSDLQSKLKSILMGDDKNIIAKETMLAWMKSDDQEVLGMISCLIHEKALFQLVKPLLTFSDIISFALPYYRRCILENPDEDSEDDLDIESFRDTRLSASYSFVALFKHTFDCDETELVVELKSWIEDFYRSEPSLHEILTTFITEHLFEHPGLRAYFADWATNPFFESEYQAACEWADYEAGLPPWPSPEEDAK